MNQRRTKNDPADAEGPSSVLAVKSASRTLDILEFVARATVPPSFVQLMQQLEIPKSSLSLLLTTLVQRGYLEQPEPRGSYRLGLGARRLGIEFSRQLSIAEQVAPLLDRLVLTIKESAGYYELRGDYVECIDARAFERALFYKMFVGERVHLYANSCGKALLAQMPDDLVHAYVARTEFRPYTERTIASPDQLLKEVEAIRENGIAASMGEYYPGVAAFAIALGHGINAVGAVNVGLPMSRLTDETREQIAAELKCAADEFARL